MDKLSFLGAKVIFEPRDLWIGVYWNADDEGYSLGVPARWIEIYICVIPTLPLKLTFVQRESTDD